MCSFYHKTRYFKPKNTVFHNNLSYSSLFCSLFITFLLNLFSLCLVLSLSLSPSSDLEIFMLIRGRSLFSLTFAYVCLRFSQKDFCKSLFDLAVILLILHTRFRLFLAIFPYFCSLYSRLLFFVILCYSSLF